MNYSASCMTTAWFRTLQAAIIVSINLFWSMFPCGPAWAAAEAPPYWWNTDVNERREKLIDDDPYEDFTYFKKPATVEGRIVPLRVTLLATPLSNGLGRLPSGVMEPLLVDSTPLQWQWKTEEMFMGVDKQGGKIVRNVPIRQAIGCHSIWLKGLMSNRRAYFEVNEPIHSCDAWMAERPPGMERPLAAELPMLRIDQYVPWAQLSKPRLMDGSRLQNTWRGALFSDSAGLWQHVCEPLPIALELRRLDGSLVWSKVYVSFYSKPQEVCGDFDGPVAVAPKSRMAPNEIGIPNPTRPDVLLADERTLLAVRMDAIYRVRLDNGSLLGSPPGLVALNYDWLAERKQELWGQTVGLPRSVRIVKLFSAVEKLVESEAGRK